VGIVAHRESLYYWDTEGKLFKRDINQTKWEQLEGSVRQASVGASGLWAIGKSTGQPYHWNAATEEWERVDAPQLTQLSIAAEQHDVVAVDGASGSLYR